VTARVTVKIHDRDMGFDAFVRRAQAAARVQVRAGVLPEDAGRRYPDSDTTVGEVAAYNELGTPKRAARPFLGAWFDRRGAAHAQAVVEILRRNLLDGQAPRALRALADRAGGEVRASLRRYNIRETGLLERSISAVADIGRAVTKVVIGPRGRR
jgi:hypothetical protein